MLSSAFIIDHSHAILRQLECTKRLSAVSHDTVYWHGSPAHHPIHLVRPYVAFLVCSCIPNTCSSHRGPQRKIGCAQKPSEHCVLQEVQRSVQLTVQSSGSLVLMASSMCRLGSSRAQRTWGCGSTMRRMGCGRGKRESTSRWSSSTLLLIAFRHAIALLLLKERSSSVTSPIASRCCTPLPLST